MTVEITRARQRPEHRLPSHAAPARRRRSASGWRPGARHEQRAEHGISHLLEHMAFKGTARRTAQDIAEEIEQVGGELNAATSLDATYYYARVLKDDMAVALDILSDILQNSLYRRGRAGARARGHPAGDRRHPRQPGRHRLRPAPGRGLHRPAARPAPSSAPPKSVAQLHQPPICAVSSPRAIARRRMVLSAAGNVDHAALVRHAEALFGGLNAGRGDRGGAGAHTWVECASRRSLSSRLMLCMGFEGVS